MKPAIMSLLKPDITQLLPATYISCLALEDIRQDYTKTAESPAHQTIEMCCYGFYRHASTPFIYEREGEP